MLWLEILLLVGIIAYSAKLGGIGVGMAGAVGMIAATAVFGLKPGRRHAHHHDRHSGHQRHVARRRPCVHGEMRRETAAEQSEIHQRTCTGCLLHADDFGRYGLHGNERFKRHSGSSQGE